MDPLQVWPLVTNPQNRGTTVVKDGRMVNCYAELDQQKNEYDVIKRPAVKDVAGYGNTVGYQAEGFFIWYKTASSAGQVLSIVAQAGLGPDRLFADNTFNANVDGVTAGYPQRWDFVPMDSSPRTLYMKQLGTGYSWDGTTATAIVDATYTAFQTNLVPGAAYLNGRMYVCTYDNQVYGAAALNSVATWNALNLIAANDTPGFAVGITRHLQYVLVFKTQNTEAFYDAGNATGSPLSRVEGARIPFGLTHFNTVASHNDQLFWVAQSGGGVAEGGDLRVVMMNGLQPQVISTPSIERLLNNTMFGSIVIFSGHRFYALGSTTEGISLWYDIDQKVWSEVTIPRAIFNASMYNSVMYYQNTDGQIWKLDPTETYDLASSEIANIQVDIYTPLMDFGTSRDKFLGALYTDGDQVTGSILQARFSDDDYQTWSEWQYLDLGTEKPRLTDQGSFEKRSYNFRHKSNTSLRLRAAQLSMELGTL